MVFFSLFFVGVRGGVNAPHANEQCKNKKIETSEMHDNPKAEYISQLSRFYHIYTTLNAIKCIIK